MAALDILEGDEWLEFTRLRAIVRATDGSLGAHLETLAREGYVAIEKLFVGRKAADPGPAHGRRTPSVCSACLLPARAARRSSAAR